MNKRIEELNQIGQSLWYDNIERKLLDDGTLAGMIQRGEIRGITSNPSIFNKAISQSDDYDDQIRGLTMKGLSREEIFEKLAVQDIQEAADLFTGLYEETGAGDGYVSLEVSPYLAHQTEETIAEAKKLWHLVDRPNLMVKIPATREGLPAITESIAAGVNVNVTLIFSLERYQEVIDAYLSGLEKRAAAGLPLDRIASVASFFISRIDSKVDGKLQDLLDDKAPEEREQIQLLAGKAGLASGKLAYLVYRNNFEGGPRFRKLAELDARPQRALWASTSTKDPAYPDTLYVDNLIGPNTVNTLPPQTLLAFLDHGQVSLSIGEDLDQYRGLFKSLKALDIDMERVTDELEQEGVKAFADSFRSLLESLKVRMGDFS